MVFVELGAHPKLLLQVQTIERPLLRKTVEEKDPFMTIRPENREDHDATPENLIDHE
jgi:hypothetical protein